MAEDPYHWNCEKVQHFFRVEAVLLLQDRPHSQLPATENFIEALANNEVTGATLLEDVDNSSLKDDLGISKLGVRGAILHCINKLRSRSATYSRQHGLNGPQPSAEAANAEQMPTPPAPAAHSARQWASEVVDPHEAANAGQSPAPLGPSAQQGMTEVVDAGGSANAHQGPTATGPSARQEMTEVVDAQGRKRRRLQLAPPQQPAKASVPKIINHGYYGDEALTVDSFFFADTGFGCETADHQHQDLLQLSTSTEPDEDSFQVLYPAATMGQTAFAEAQMRHFLASREEIVSTERKEFKRAGRDAMAVLPYRDSQRLHVRSALVLHFPEGRQEPVATRELAAYLYRKDPFNEAGVVPLTESAADDMEILDHKFGGDADEILPLWNEDERNELMSVSEEDPDDEESAQNPSNSRFLTKERVMEIIDERIEELIDEWNSKLPDLERKRAWTVWKKTKQRRSVRDGLIQAARGSIKALDHRIAKIKDWLLSDKWENEKSLIRSCENMEVSVEEREERKWEINVWERHKEPTHTVCRGTGRHRPGQVSKSYQQGARKDDFELPNDRFSVSPTSPQRNADERMIDVTSPATNDTYDPAELNAHEGDDENEMADAEPDYDPADGLDGLLLTEDAAANSPDTMDVDQPSPWKDAASKTVTFEPKAVASEETGSAYELSAANGHGSGSSADESVTPRRRRESQRQVIDLSHLSDSAGPSSSPITTPSRKGKTKTSANGIKMPSTDPFQADATEIASWDVHDAAGRNDRQRLLIKLFSILGADLRERIHKLFGEVGKPEFMSLLSTSVQALHSGTFDPTGNEVQVRLIRLHAACILPTKPVLNLAMEPSLDAQFPTITIQEWAALMDQGQLDLSVKLMFRILNAKGKLFGDGTKPAATMSGPAKSISKKSKKSKIPDSAEVFVISDEEVPSKRARDSGSQHTPHKKRKKDVKKSKFGDQSRKNALERQKKYEEVVEAQTSGQLDPTAFVRTEINGVSVMQIEINPARGENEEPIYIVDQIAEKLKNHQIDGIRFMWREITASNNEEESNGCILAHTMGLGKSMQVLALLAAVATVAESSNAKVYRQLPNELRPRGGQRLRFLILCPPGLIQNWRREIDQWLPKDICNIFSLEASQGPYRERYVDEWAQAGGILLVGYNIFRTLVEPSGVVAPALTTTAEHLLSDTDIVVADEAHYLKNQTAAVTKAANRIETRFRIGLSGTPLSNNVQEIYALVSWVSPGYLGDPVEFRAHYVEPIQEGLYDDSSHHEKRKSIKKLKVLHHEIGPKVNRATIEALRGSLKPKIEFVITVPLTKRQANLYRRFINAILRGKRNDAVVTGRIFGWLSLLTLLTNHPRCFQRKLLEPPKTANSKTKSQMSQESPMAAPPENVSASLRELLEESAEQQTNTESAERQTNTESAEQQTNPSSDDPDRAPGDEHVSALGLTPLVIQEILQGAGDLFDIDPSLSSKAAVFTQLLFSCLACKDKALIFSTSIPTLQYLDDLLREYGIPFGRIDGSVPIDKRMQIIENFHKDEFDVMLISTRAGGLGLNIQGANRVFIFDFSFNPSWEEQAIGRAYRIGQTKPVYVYRFVAGGTFEHNIYNTQLFKSSLAQRVVDKKKPRRSAERAPGEWLYEPQPVPQKDIAAWIGKDEHVLDLLIARHAPNQQDGLDTMIREICTMETLQQEALDAPLDPEEEQEVKKEIEEGRDRRTKKSAHIPTGASFKVMSQVDFGHPVG